MYVCAENSSAVQNGLDKRSQHSWQTTEIVEVHMPPAFSNGPVDTVINGVTPSEHEDYVDNALTHDNPGLGNGDMTSRTPDPELERDYNDNSVFPSPPVFVVNADPTVTDWQSENVTDSSITQATVGRSDLVPTETLAPDTVTSTSVVSDVTPPVPPTLSVISTSTAPPPPPPPPPPPLPTSFSTAAPPPLKPANSSSQPQWPANKDARRPSLPVPPQVQADLLAAVARRRTLVDSTDAEQIAKSIECRVQRNSKLQTVYRSGSHSSEQCKSPTTPTAGLLAPASKPDQPRAAENGKCWSHYYTIQQKMSRVH